jgi:IS5 family transposase
MLVSRLENLVSDRRLIEHCSLRLDILYFLGYEVDEDLPWHSTISRTRQLYPATIFEQLFEHVFAQCVAAGLVTGHTQAVDSAFVKANASLESLCEKQPADAPTPVLHVADRPAQDAPDAPALRASPAHHLQRVAAAHARYARHDSGPIRARPTAGAATEQQNPLQSRSPTPASRSSPARRGPSITSVVWPWMRVMALSAIYKPILLTVVTAPCCQASSSRYTSGCSLMTCP